MIEQFEEMSEHEASEGEVMIAGQGGGKAFIVSGQSAEFALSLLRKGVAGRPSARRPALARGKAFAPGIQVGAERVWTGSSAWKTVSAYVLN